MLEVSRYFCSGETIRDFCKTVEREYSLCYACSEGKQTADLPLIAWRYNRNICHNQRVYRGGCHGKKRKKQRGVAGRQDCLRAEMALDFWGRLPLVEILAKTTTVNKGNATISKPHQ